MGSGEWGVGNGEWGMGSGEWGVGSGWVTGWMGKGRGTYSLIKKFSFEEFHVFRRRHPLKHPSTHPPIHPSTHPPSIPESLLSAFTG